MNSAATAQQIVLPLRHCQESAKNGRTDVAAVDGAKYAKQLLEFSKARTVSEFAYLLVNSLCNQVDCEQVGLGLVTRGRIRVSAVSGCSQIKAGSPGVSAMSQAMDEAVDQKEFVGFPNADHTPSFSIHRRWSQEVGGCYVCSIPLFSDDEVVGIVSLRRSCETPFGRDDVKQLQEALVPYGGLLSLVDRANRSLAQKMVESTRSWLAGQRSRTRICVAAIVVILVSWSVLGRMTYRPRCDAVIVAADLQHMTAPFEARLHRVHVNAGDRVVQGDILVEFDTRQMELDLDTIRAESTRTEVSRRAAIEDGDVSTAALHRAHMNVLLAQESAMERRIETARIVAPSDGMVIQSDFDNRLGQVFSQGAPVLQFAPHDGWRLLIHIPEDVATYVEPNDEGAFASSARPNDKIEFTVEQTNGSAEVIDQQNVFVAKANLGTGPTWMRTGMKGIARINTRKMAPWWIAFHKVIDWTRLRFWI